MREEKRSEEGEKKGGEKTQDTAQKFTRLLKKRKRPDGRAMGVYLSMAHSQLRWAG